MKKLLEKIQKIWPWVVGGYLYLVLLFPKLAILPTAWGTPIRLEDLLLLPVLITTLILHFRPKSFPRETWPFHLFFLILTVIFFLSTLIGTFRGSLGRPDLAFIFVLRMVEYFTFFYLAFLTFRSFKAIFVWIAGLILIALPIALFAILQYFGVVGGWGGGQFAYQFFNEIPQGRVFSTFSGPYELGAFLIIILLFILAFFPYVKQLYQKCILLLIYLSGVLALSYTGSRIPLLALVVGGLITLFFSPSKKKTSLLLALALITPFFTSRILVERYDLLLAHLELSFNREPTVSPVPPSLIGTSVAYNLIPLNKELLEAKEEGPVTSEVTLPEGSLSLSSFSASLSETTSASTAATTSATVPSTNLLTEEKKREKELDPYQSLPNLLKAGGFEKSEGWQLFGKAKVIENLEKAYEGTRFLQLEPDEEPQGVSWEIKNLDPYKRYRLSLKVYRETPEVVFRFVTNNEADWFPVMSYQGYRGKVPLSGVGQIYLKISKNAPSDNWSFASVDFDSVTDLKAFTPNNRVIKGVFRIDDIKLQEIGAIHSLVELAAPASPKLFGLPILDKSLAGRVSLQWPLVMAEFKNSPIVGGGMSVMGTGVDGEFMTLLAETGLLGFLAFVSFLVFIEYWLWRKSRQSLGVSKIFYVALMSLIAAIVVEGVFVDVFRASKIASLFWFLVGLGISFSFINSVSPRSSREIDEWIEKKVRSNRFFSRAWLFFAGIKAFLFSRKPLEFIFDYLLLFFLAFNVLFPKIPLYGTGVMATPIRVDDLVTAGLLGGTIVLGLVLKRKLLPSKDRLLLLAALFVGMMVVSSGYGIVTGVVPDYKLPGLFIFRQLEYMIPLYVGLVTLHSFKQIKIYLITFTLLVIPVAIHTFLQLYGIWGGYGGGFYNYQYVRVDDRVFASFSGPYEIGAYFVITLSLIAALVVGLKRWFRVGAVLLFALAIYSFSFINARIPLVALFVSMLFLIPATRKIFTPLLIAFVILVAPVFISPIAQYRVNQFISEINMRYLKDMPYFKDDWFQTNIRIYIGSTVDRVDKFYQARSEGIKIPWLSNDSFNKEKTGSSPEKTENQDVISQTTPAKESEGVQSELVISEPTPENFPKEEETNPAPTPPPPPISETKRLYERFALSDGSLSWRLETHWPKAIETWQKSLLIGSGMSVVGIGVDSEYLTLLAETGLVGLVIFSSFLGYLIYRSFSVLRKINLQLDKALLSGVTVALIGLVIEGVLVDVFRASKIAYLFWFFVAVVIVSTKLGQNKKEQVTLDQLKGERLGS
jgi:hypothetical protein